MKEKLDYKCLTTHQKLNPNNMAKGIMNYNYEL